MYKKRTFLRVVIKLLIFVPVVILSFVFLKSLFPSIEDKSYSSDKKTIKTVQMQLSGMQSGDIRKVRWKGREVGILKREEMSFGYTKYIAKLPHKSLHSGSRSRVFAYFVYYNQGDSGNCPLFYDAKGFKDICSGKRFHSNGREVNNQQNGALIEIPPHYFNSTDNGNIIELVVGKWEK